MTLRDRFSFCLITSGMVLAGPAMANSTQDTIMATGGTVKITANDLVLNDFGLTLQVGSENQFGRDGLLALTVVGDHPYRMLGATIPLSTSLTISSNTATVRADSIALQSVPQGYGYDYDLVDQATGRVLFQVSGGAFNFDPDSAQLAISDTWLQATSDVAAQLGEPRAAVNQLASMNINADMVVVRTEPFGDAEHTGGLPGGGDGSGPRAGGDVVYTGVNGISNHGVVGAYAAFTLGTDTCNIGNANISWTNNGTPGIGFNAFKINNGRLTQIGQGFVKTACCAAAGNGCGLSCNGQGGSVLGAGCLDVYGSGWNSSQGRLMARSQINAWTGTFGTIPSGSGDAVWRRAQVATADMTPTSALYFLEGVYVGTQDSQSGNRNNNASYIRATVSGTSFSLAGATVRYLPAITAWRANGLGVGVVDTRVVDGVVDVPNEGRFHTAVKVTDNGDGTFTYDYAIYNLSSDRSGGSFEVPIPAGANITNVGFNGVRYHSGEPYDNTPWTQTVSAGSVRWASPQTFTQNANSNALRWGTMYNFWFTANVAPAPGTVTLGLFKPHTPDSVTFNASVPSGPPPLLGDLDDDGDVDIEDLAQLLSNFGCTPSSPALCVGDINGDGFTDIGDLALLLSNFGAGG